MSSPLAEAPVSESTPIGARVRKLRVAITVDPYLPVPPTHYGGIERVVDLAVRGLLARGHDVTLFAHPESRTAATLVPYGMPPHTGSCARSAELWQLGTAVWRRRANIDVVFSWGRLAALLPILPYRDLPKIQRYCRDLVPWAGVQRAVRLAGDSLQFAGASASVYDERPRYGALGGRWFTLYDAVDVSRYRFVPRVERAAPVAFLGRLERIKGAHAAIEIARRAGRKLIIAGTRSTAGADRDYFDGEIAPHLDGDQVQYVGPVDDRQKSDLLGSAAALLFPIDWKEAFGIVMAESLACGTPVIGFDRGSVAEVVRHGSTGFVCRDVDEAAAYLSRLDELDRAAAREDCIRRFAAEVFVTALEQHLLEAVA